MGVRTYLSGNPIHDRVLSAFHEGISGSQKELVKTWHYEPSDIAVIFGVYKSKIVESWPRGAVFRRQREKNLDVIVLETGYVNRGDGEAHHYAAGFNGLNGRADFKNQGSPPDRVEKLGVKLKPWRDSGDHIVLCGQVPWDASVDHSDHLAWLKDAALWLRECSKRPIRFRPHPLARLVALEGCDYSIHPLTEDLKNAWACVTFNSNSAVEAAIEGVPVFAFDTGSMAWPVANKTFWAITSPEKPDRRQWLNDLCYAQWTPNELKEGLAWKHLTCR